MQANNPFDGKLEILGSQIPRSVRDASIFINDTLELCWASTQSVFEEKATPEIAMAIYDRVVNRIAAEEDEKPID